MAAVKRAGRSIHLKQPPVAGVAHHLLALGNMVRYATRSTAEDGPPTSINKTMRTRLLGCFTSLLILASATVSRAADTLINFNDFWFYLDNGTDQGTNWRNAGIDFYFDWPLGFTEMGFGEGDEFTVLNASPGGVPLNTAYFATMFTVNNSGLYSNLTVRLLRDDGGIVYLNGVEVFRSNMPTGAVNYVTKALRNIDGAEESLVAQRVVPASVLVNGDNTLAVEVHQANGGNDDMSFALVLIGHRVGENQPPSADSSFVTTEQDRSVAVTLNATDPDNNPLTYTVLSSPQHGSLSGTAPNLTYTPEAGYVGPDLFSFMASDGQWNTEVAYVSIDVKVPSNHPPVADAQNVTVAEDNSLNITLTATDPDGDTLSYSHTSPAHGTLTGSGNSLLYQPAQNYFGPDSFTFSVDDGHGATSTATINISVTPVNDAPVADAQSLVTAEDTALDIVLTGSDVEGDALSFSFGQPAHGVVMGSGSHVTYQPAANYNGPDAFNFVVNDGNGGTATATVNINVTPVNDNPTAASQSVTVNEDSSVGISLAASDVDGDALTYSYTQPAHGVVTGSGNQVTYQPAANYNGPDAFNFVVNDGNGGTATATVHIVVTPVNDNPTADSQSVTTAEDTALPITLTGSDVDGDTLTFTHDQPAHGTLTGTGNQLVYQPAANYNGPDAFNFTVNDGNGGTASATVHIVVTPVNDNPTADSQSLTTAEDTALPITLTGSDVDGDILAFTYGQPAHGTLTGTGNQLVYQPAPNYNGPDSFMFAVNDGNGGGASATVTINVTPVNDNPTAASQSVTVSEDSSVSISLAASDVDGDVLTYSYTQPAHGVVSGSGNSVVYQPAANYNGPDSFTFTVTDGNGGTATATINITVAPVNDAPVARAKVASTSDPKNFTRVLVVLAANGQSAQVILNGSSSSDPDGDTLTYAWYDGANPKPLSTKANATVSLPVGKHAVSLVVSDGTAKVRDTVTVGVVTPCDAVQRIAAEVQAADLRANERNILLNRLDNACLSFNSGDMAGGVHQLELFQERVEDKVSDLVLAKGLIDKAQRIIDAVSGVH